jgi:hypothetical protein
MHGRTCRKLVSEISACYYLRSDGTGFHEGPPLKGNEMTTAAHNLLTAFDALPLPDQQSVAAEILRRTTSVDELSDDARSEVADAVLQLYDAEEAESGEG